MTSQEPHHPWHPMPSEQPPAHPDPISGGYSGATQPGPPGPYPQPGQYPPGPESQSWQAASQPGPYPGPPAGLAPHQPGPPPYPAAGFPAVNNPGPMTAQGFPPAPMGAPWYPTPPPGSLAVSEYQSWQYLGDQPKLPVVPRQYHEFWRAPGYRWWKGLLALVATVVAAAILMFAAGIVSYVLEPNSFIPPNKVIVSPTIFLLNNISLALIIPIVLLIQWPIIGLRPKWISSVTGGIRWRWLGWSALVIFPIWIVYYATDTTLSGGLEGLATNKNTVLMIIYILITTPLQCAGEEYFCRGLLARAVGSWIPHRNIGLIVSALVSSVAFMFFHQAQDIWLNIFYFGFGLFASYLVWRTGGLEAAIVLHVTNNLLAEATMPFVDFSHMFDREAGTGSPSGLIVFIGFAVIAVVLEFVIRKKKPTQAANPGLSDQAGQQFALATAGDGNHYYPQPMPGYSPWSGTPPYEGPVGSPAPTTGAPQQSEPAADPQQHAWPGDDQNGLGNRGPSS